MKEREKGEGEVLGRLVLRELGRGGKFESDVTRVHLNFELN